MKSIIAIIAISAAASFAGDCVTTDKGGNTTVVPCSQTQTKLQSGGSATGDPTQAKLQEASQTRTQYQQKTQMDSATYQAEVKTQMETKLQTMEKNQADQAKVSGEAAQTRTQDRKAKFVENKGN